MKIAMISRNRVIAVCTPPTVVSRSVLMSVIITFMFEPAKLQMNWASASGSRMRRGEMPKRVCCVGGVVGRGAKGAECTAASAVNVGG